jgi:fructose-1,6-bisphosphatase
VPLLVQGKEQKKLDVLANDILINTLCASGRTSLLVSEELEDVLGANTVARAAKRNALKVTVEPQKRA